MKVLVLHGPNLNTLETREPSLYGTKTLAEIDLALVDAARKRGCELESFQSNGEGDLIDAIQAKISQIDGLLINPGALTHYGLSLRDAVSALRVPTVEVHLTNIYAREDWRATSVIAPVASGQVSGLGWRSYIYALEALIDLISPPSQ